MANKAIEWLIQNKGNCAGIRCAGCPLRYCCEYGFDLTEWGICDDIDTGSSEYDPFILKLAKMHKKTQN